MNTCISTKMRNWENKNANSGTKKMTMTKMITNMIKTSKKNGTISLTGGLLCTLYCP